MPRQERPLGVEDTPLLRFAGDLRRLRQRAGSPSYRDLGRRANYSAAALSEAVAGRRLPSLSVTTAFVRACDGDLEEWTARWRDLAAAAPGNDTATPSPYIGLAAYQIEDADRFFGREAVLADLQRLLKERPFVGVFGASGTGKSSLLRAGLAAASEPPALVVTPRGDPRTELATALAARTGEPAARLGVQLAAEPEALGRRLSRVSKDLLLVVDQFEETFTLCAEEDRAWLVRALTSAGPDVRVVLGVRADFYGHCGRYPELTAALHQAQLLLGPMSSEELRRAVTEPAARVGSSLETALVARLVADVAGQPGALPLVSHALAETWRRRRGVVLSLGAYEDAGGVEHALARTAERTFESLSPAEQESARLLFLRLVAPGDGTGDTRRRVRREELDAPADLVDRLASARLVSVDRDSVDLTHEALLRAWPRLAGWIAEDREGLLQHRRLAAALEVWEESGRDPDALHRGVLLDQAASLRDRLNPQERAFLDASEAAERAAAARRRRVDRRLRRLVVALTVLAGLLAGTVVVAVGTQRAATRERNQALSLRAADGAGELMADRPREAVSLALEAYRLSPTDEARGALMLAQAMSAATALGDGFALPPGRLAITSESRPDGEPRGLRLWARDGAGWRRAARLPVDFAYLGSPGQHTVITSGRAGIEDVRPLHEAWDLTDPDHPQRIVLPAGLSMVTSMDRTGQVLAGTGKDDVGVVWRRADGVVRRLPGRGVEDVALSPDASSIVVSRREGDVRVAEWLSGEGGRPRALLRRPERLYSLVGAGDRVAVIGSETGTAVLLDLREPASPRTVATAGGFAPLTFFAFDSRGDALATAGPDQVTVRDSATGAIRLSLRTVRTTLSFPAFRADGRLMVLDNRNRLLLLDPDIDRVVRQECTTPTRIDRARWFPDSSRPRLCP